MLGPRIVILMVVAIYPNSRIANNHNNPLPLNSSPIHQKMLFSLPPLLLLFPFIFLLLHHRVTLLRASTAAGNWPCPIGPSPTCPGYPRLSCTALSYSCPPPQCQNDGQCSPLRCVLANGLCEDYPEPKLSGTKCSLHRECGMEMICVDEKCEEGGKSGRIGSYRSCAKSIECPPIEDCEEGVCLIRLPEDVVIDQKTTTNKPKPSSGTIGEEGAGFQRENGLNVWSIGWCSPNGQCPGAGNGAEAECIPMGTNGRQQCFPRQFFNLQGQLIPPPPGHPHCRDSNSPPAQPSEHCEQRKWLCQNGLYLELMGQQCPRSCGKCEDFAVVEELLRDGKVQTKIWTTETEKTNELIERNHQGEKEAMNDEAKGKNRAKWKQKKKKEEELMDELLEMANRGCIDHWDGGEWAKLAHLCTNEAYKKQLARFCPRTCRHC